MIYCVWVQFLIQPPGGSDDQTSFMEAWKLPGEEEEYVPLTGNPEVGQIINLFC